MFVHDLGYVSVSVTPEEVEEHQELDVVERVGRLGIFRKGEKEALGPEVFRKVLIP